jgi:hypothetical protein
VTVLPRWIPATLLAFALAGCSEFQIANQYDGKTDFSKLSSYSWTAPTRVATGSGGVTREFVDESVRTAIDNKLAKKGYRRTSTDAADFLITYRTVIKRKVESADLDGQQGYGAGLGRSDDYGAAFGAGSNSITEEYEEGTIVVTMLSKQGERRLWSGSARAALMENASDEARSERMGRAIKRILAQFPPK